MDATALPIRAPGARSASFALCPRTEDAHWQRCWRREAYHRAGLDYEDYAPAYCVGYVGYAQYGGTYEDALASLCANWARLKGDSRLSLDEALAAIRAAWDRVAGQAQEAEQAEQGRWHGDYQDGAALAGRAPSAGTVLAQPGSSSGFPHAASFPIRRPLPAPQAE